MSLEGRLMYKGFEAWVTVDNKPLPLVRPVYTEARDEATAWVASEEGKTFVVCYAKKQRDGTDYETKLFLDGRKVCSSVHAKKAGGISGVKEISSTNRVSPTETLDFMFSRSTVTDDDAYLDDPSSLCVGEIKIVLRRVKVTRIIRRKATAEGRVHRQIPESPKIHERHKKALVHQIQYSKRKTSHRSSAEYHRSIHRKPIEEPIVFTFKYRSLDVLQAKGIAPRPTPLDDKRDEAACSQASVNTEVKMTNNGFTYKIKQEGVRPDAERDEDEIDEILVKERALLAELESIRSLKRARIEVNLATETVKTEPIRHFAVGEVIDLT